MGSSWKACAKSSAIARTSSGVALRMTLAEAGAEVVMARSLRAARSAAVRRASRLALDPAQDLLRVGQHGPSRQLQRRELRVAGGGTQVLARALAQERDRVAVRGDHLLVLEALLAQGL